jgi:hypothetical protein
MAGRDADPQGSPGDSLMRQTDQTALGAGQPGKRVLGAPVNRETALVGPATKSAARQVSGRLKAAIDLMTWHGKPYDEAAKAAGLTTRALRMALEKEHVLRYMRSQRRALLASEGPRTIIRLTELRENSTNMNAAVAASRTILSIADDDARRAGPGHGATQPGFVIVCRGDVDVHPPPQPVIEGTVVPEDREPD